MPLISPFVTPTFPRASRYDALFAKYRGCEVREPRAGEVPYPWTERHLQCVWFDPAFRPPNLQTTLGETVVVEEPGVWNPEAGPDFLNASLKVGSGSQTRTLRGDVEIHIRPSDWLHHGHSRDPRYANVVAHVTYFAGNAPVLPAGAVSIALAETLWKNRAFSFDLIDVAAYPWPVRASRPPCAEPFSRMSPDEILSFLESAGEHRLQRKAARFEAEAGERDPHQRLYEELFTALGYKHNRMPFRMLARRVPLQTLRQYAGNDPLRAYALLTGVSGLLPTRLHSRWDDETRTFLRRVWNCWWKLAEAWAGHVMHRSEWNLSGLRPLNHPLRRIMAAAHLFCNPTPLPERLLNLSDPDNSFFLEQITRIFSEMPEDPYWSWRNGFGGTRSKKPIALLGRDRAIAITLNVAIPFLASQDHLPSTAQDLLRTLPPEADHRILRTTANLLFGREHSPKLYSTALARQGLIQIFQDFCLQDRTRCHTCPLPAILKSPRGSDA